MPPRYPTHGVLNDIVKPVIADRIDLKKVNPSKIFQTMMNKTYSPDALSNTGPYKGIVLRVEKYSINGMPGTWVNGFYDTFFSEDKTTPLTAISRPDDSTYFFTVCGILILLAFIFLFKRDRRIRGDLRRALQRPHGFITDIRENRKIPFPETIGLGLIILLLLALFSAAFVFYFKNNFYFDQILSLLLNYPIKAWLLPLVWQPHFLLLAFLFGYFLAFFSGAILITLFAKLLGKKTSFHKAITFLFWMNSVVLIFLPAGPIFFNLLSLKGYLPIISGGFGLALLVAALRSIHGLAVLYLEKKRFIFLMVFLLLALLVVGGGFYFQKNNALFDYLALYLNAGH